MGDRSKDAAERDIFDTALSIVPKNRVVAKLFRLVGRSDPRLNEIFERHCDEVAQYEDTQAITTECLMPSDGTAPKFRLITSAEPRVPATHKAGEYSLGDHTDK